ncbi:asparagine synthetase B [Lusitaniella coriacea LEGE 07157]|uniref:asparagine synthase (glutamine-hydrolyzing) n=1 Tax=Lusitaniella coriacea LEGE 07157 TaxID=945747 RepID=A0A8J7E0G5_9CYAN|nr:asparagine synthase-related protein [Lusitaniella coriacea]MBE9118216.1 asparagine synthetase B [Lusitaniella coriacea LEGE 07157]
MSGICGILHLDEEPIDRALLKKMTAFLAYRGSDAKNLWIEGSVAFGHCLLRTTNEAVRERQPYTLDGETYIIADARIDGRETLIPRLQAKGCEVTTKDPDSALILHAYGVWGEDCLEYLLGDFAFGIWDERKQRLFCARDPFGIKLFYYAHLGNCFIFSNTLNCIRCHPKVSQELNDRAIADFLLFDLNTDLKTTTFADIQCLPAASKLTLEAGNLQQKTYWTLPIPEQIRYKKATDYLEHFRELMGLAVKDRLRAENASIFLSGGLDSTAIALAAVEGATPLNLQAITVGYERLIPDEERDYAQLAAKALEIPSTYLIADDCTLYQGWDKSELHFPEPRHAPLALITLKQLQQAARHSPIVLCGQGGDEALKFSTVAEMLPGMPWRNIAVDAVRCLLFYNLQPAWGSGFLGQIRRWQGKQPQLPSLPPWLNPDLVERFDLNARWERFQQPSAKGFHPPRDRAYQSLQPTPLWNLNFVAYDPGTTQIPVEVRLPFLDLRLLDYLLSLPPLPWCADKTLLRLALRGKLPDPICQRPKTPLAANPVCAHFKNQQATLLQNFTPSSQLKAYINPQKWQEVLSCKMSTWQTWRNLRPISLGYWLEGFKHPF